MGKGSEVDECSIVALLIAFFDVERQFQTVDELLYDVELPRSQLVWVRALYHIRHLAIDREETVGLIKVGVDFEQEVVTAQIQAVLRGSDLLAEIVVAYIALIQYEVDEASLWHPVHTSGPSNGEGHIVTQEGAVNPVGKQRPSFVGRHVEYVRGLVEFEGVGHLRESEGAIASAADAGGALMVDCGW